MIEGISAITLGTHEMPRTVRFYRALGFEVLHGGEESSFTSLRAGVSYLNLIVQPAERRWSWWGRVIFYVTDVDALYNRALAAACQSKGGRESVWCSDYPLNLGGIHAVQDNRTMVARRDGASRPRDRTNDPCCTGNYPNSGRRNQTADRHGRAAAFQSGEHHSSAGREERRLGGQRHPLPDVRIDRGRARWRDQNAQRRRWAVYRRRKDRGANGGQQRAINFPP